MRRFHLTTAIYLTMVLGIAGLAFGLTKDPPPVGRVDTDITKSEFLDAPWRWFGVTTADAPGDVAPLRNFAAAAAKPPSMWMYWRDWSAPLQESDIREASAQHVVPMIAWEPWTFGLRTSAAQRFSLRTIADGDWDDLIDASARAVNDAGRTVIIRFAHEMNGDWYPWGVGVNGNRSGDYAAAWRHVWQRFERAGANDSVIWVWSPNNIRVTTPPLRPLYPGDRYVDLVGVSAFMGYGTLTPTRWPRFNDSFGATVLTMRTFTRKKVLITEMGALEKGTLKQEWLESVFDGIEGSPDIIGFLWFEFSKNADWRIGTSPASRRVFASRVASGQYH